MNHFLQKPNMAEEKNKNRCWTCYGWMEHTYGVLFLMQYRYSWTICDTCRICHLCQGRAKASRSWRQTVSQRQKETGCRACSQPTITPTRRPALPPPSSALHSLQIRLADHYLTIPHLTDIMLQYAGFDIGTIKSCCRSVCGLWSRKCCSCSDLRMLNDTYQVTVHRDGRGMVKKTCGRKDFYCPACQNNQY